MIPILQNQLDALLDFDASANDLTNGVINAAFMLLFRDLIRLFACYNDGIINLLEKFFDMNRKQCREALDIYKKFLIRMDRVAEFLKTAENVGIDKGEIPDLARAPSSLLEALEAHYASLESNKKAKYVSDIFSIFHTSIFILYSILDLGKTKTKVAAKPPLPPLHHPRPPHRLTGLLMEQSLMLRMLTLRRH